MLLFNSDPFSTTVYYIIAAYTVATQPKSKLMQFKVFFFFNSKFSFKVFYFNFQNIVLRNGSDELKEVAHCGAYNNRVFYL